MFVATFQRQAVLDWTGDIASGAGQLHAASGAFDLAATFPRVAGDPAGITTPEELLAGAHATCFGIGLRSVLAQHGGAAARLQVTATITAEKGRGVIRIRRSDLTAVVTGLTGLDPARLEDLARIAEQACTISHLLRATVPVTVTVRQAS